MTIAILVLQCVTLLMQGATLLILRSTRRTNRETERLLGELIEIQKVQVDAAERMKLYRIHNRSIPTAPLDGHPGIETWDELLRRLRQFDREGNSGGQVEGH